MHLDEDHDQYGEGGGSVQRLRTLHPPRPHTNIMEETEALRTALKQVEELLAEKQRAATETDALRVQLKATKSKVAGFGFAAQKANAMSVQVTAAKESLQAERMLKGERMLKHLEKELGLTATKSKSRRMWFFVCAMVCALCAWVLSTLIRADGAVSWSASNMI